MTMYKIIELVDGGESETICEDDELAFRMWSLACNNIENNFDSKCQLFFNDEMISIYRHSGIVPYPKGRKVLVQTSMTGRKGEEGIIKEILPSGDGYPLQYVVEFNDVVCWDKNHHPVEFKVVEEYWVHGDLWLCPNREENE